MTVKITVIGSANVDFIMQTPRLPAVGETITGGHFKQTFGGKGANQAVAAARAGAQVTFVAALGHDATGQSYLEQLKKDGLDTTHVSLEADTPSGTALVMFDDKGDNYLTVAPGANDHITPQRVDAAEQAIAQSDWAILQREIPDVSNARVMALAQQHGCLVMLNYAPAHDLALKPGPRVHALIVNETEAAALASTPVDPTNTAACMKLATQLRDTGGHQLVVITLGKDGAVFADAAGAAHAQAFNVKAADSTAAGDTFCGCLAVALSEGKPLAGAVHFASAASALSVTRVGAQDSIPTRDEIEAFLADTR